jgi:CheY-like chemotaxis protein
MTEDDLILVVDDDPDIRLTLSEVLENAGYCVASAANGEEALQFLRSSGVPCLILLDLMMPRMDGYQFRAEQRKDPALATIPVVILTAGASQPDELEAVAVFRKPFNVDRLVAVVGQHC